MVEEGSSKKLTITAPNAKGEAPKEDAPLEEKIKYTIAAEVNPQLASHGGFVDTDALIPVKIFVD
jgi:Fe/S biogenesis protein NfuA